MLVSILLRKPKSTWISVSSNGSIRKRNRHGAMVEWLVLPAAAGNARTPTSNAVQGAQPLSFKFLPSPPAAPAEPILLCLIY